MKTSAAAFLALSTQSLAGSIPSVTKLFVDPSYEPSAKDSAYFQTIHQAQQRAQDILHTHTDLSDQQVEIHLKSGKHFLKEPLRLTSLDNGLKFIGEGDDTVVSGGVVLDGWAACSEDGSLLCASVGGIINTQSRHLFVGERRATRTEANEDILNAFINPVAYDDNKYTVELLGSNSLSDWSNPDTVELVYTAPPACQWTESRCTLLNVTATEVDNQFDVYVKQPCFSIVQYKPCGQGTVAPTSIENTGWFDLMPGQWYFSSETSTVYLSPLNTEEASSISSGSLAVVMPVLELLVSAFDTHDVVFDNLIYEHATWLRPSQALGYVEQQSGALVSEPAYNGECDDKTWKSMPGNLIFNGSTGISITNCQFKHLGAHALYFTGGCQNNEISSNKFSDISGAAIQIGDYDTQYEADETKQDRNNLVFNNLISGAAIEYHGNVGVSVGYTVETNITHNEISDLSYGGVSIGWGWGRYEDTIASDNHVEYNYIHHFKLLLGDGGGIYALGPQPNSFIRHNHVSEMGSGKGGGGYYPDEGSAFWDVSNNVFSNASYCSDDCEWLHIWTSSIHNITVHDCYTDTSTEVNAGTDCPEYDNTLVSDNDWPSEACEIASNAGLLYTSERLFGSISPLVQDCNLA